MIKRSFSHLHVIPEYSVNQFEILTQKIKGLEKSYELKLAPSLPFLIRLDGCCFKAFTKGLQKPFDPRLTASLIKTTEYLVDRTGARVGFCQSDEISLLVKPTPPDPTLSHTPSILYNGRVQKIASIIAGMATNKFNQTLKSFDWSQDTADVQHKIMHDGAYFDCRVFSVPDDTVAMQVIYWRHHYDCRRNAINTIGFHHFPHRQMHGLSVAQVLEKLAIERNINVLESFPLENVYGSFVKRVVVPHIGYNPRTGEEVHTTRNRVEARSFDLQGEEESMIALMTAMSWNDIDAAKNDSLHYGNEKRGFELRNIESLHNNQ